MSETITDKVKTALRISHTKLDSEIADNIATARAEMVRLGITESKAEDDTDPLIVTAIKTYVLSVMASSDENRKGYDESWKYQLDCLSKTSAYITETSDV